MTYKMQAIASNASIKRSRRGNERRWNRLGEPFAHMLGGAFKITKEWLNRKINRHERKYNMFD